MEIFSSVQSLSHVLLFATPWAAALQASMSITHQLPELAQTHVHQVGDAIQHGSIRKRKRKMYVSPE